MSKTYEEIEMFENAVFDMVDSWEEKSWDVPHIWDLSKDDIGIDGHIRYEQILQLAELIKLHRMAESA